MTRPFALAVASSALLSACAPRPLPGSAASVRRSLAEGVERVDEIVTLPTRAGVTQFYLLLTVAGARPRAVAVLFPGGDGVVGLPADVRETRLGANFLVRSRDLFRGTEVAAAIVEVPSDRSGGMDDAFRAGDEHRQDVAAVVADLRARFPSARVFLVGTSRGTVSAAHLGHSLGRAVDGVVLTSTVFLGSRGGPGLEGFDFGAIPSPLLFVHHEEDGCRVCPYARALALARAYPLVTVRGGRPAESDPCQARSAHGYLGREAGTVRAIRAWMLGERPPPVVE